MRIYYAEKQQMHQKTRANYQRGHCQGEAKQLDGVKYLFYEASASNQIRGTLSIQTTQNHRRSQRSTTYLPNILTRSLTDVSETADSRGLGLLCAATGRRGGLPSR